MAPARSIGIGRSFSCPSAPGTGRPDCPSDWDGRHECAGTVREEALQRDSGVNTLELAHVVDRVVAREMLDSRDVAAPTHDESSTVALSNCPALTGVEA